MVISKTLGRWGVPGLEMPGTGVMRAFRAELQPPLRAIAVAGIMDRGALVLAL